MSTPTMSACPTTYGLAPDPALPHRDRLLDDADAATRLREALARAGVGELTGSCTRIRAKYRLGESLRVTLRLGEPDAAGVDGGRLVSARMFPPDTARVQAERARATAARLGAPPGAVAVDEELGTVFWTFPHDRKLEGIEALADPPERAREAFGRRWTRSELVAYSPEKAATARCLDADGVVLGYAKITLGRTGASSLALLQAARQAVRGGGALTLPVPVAYLPQHRLALCSAAPGVPLQVVPRRAVPRASGWLGAALGQLHRRAPTTGRPPFTRLGVARIRSAGAIVGAARPDLSRLAEEVVQGLLATAPVSRTAALLHGDLHPKNVLVHASGVSLVDLDQAAVGPPAAEVGGLLARLWCPRPDDDIDLALTREAAGAFRAAYPVPVRDEDLRWYAAAALLVERAARAVNRVDAATLDDLEGVLTRARAWSRSAGRM